MIRKVMTLIKNMIKVARVLSVDDSGDYRSGQFAYLGRQVQGLVFSPYGLLHHPPNNSMAVVLAQNAQGSNALGIVDDPVNRPLKNLAEGEVALANYLTESNIHLQSGGNIVLTVGSTTITIADGTVTINGAVLQVNDNINSSDTITATNEVTAGSINLTTHNHIGSPTAPSGPISNTGAPV